MRTIDIRKRNHVVGRHRGLLPVGARLAPIFSALISADVSALPPSVINSVLGAFTTTFGSFLIPALAWNLYYSSDERVKQMPKPIASAYKCPRSRS